MLNHLFLDSIEDSTSTSFLPRTQQTLRSPSKRYAPYSYDAGGNTFYSGNSGYYGNQIKSNFEGLFNLRFRVANSVRP